MLKFYLPISILCIVFVDMLSLGRQAE